MHYVIQDGFNRAEPLFLSELGKTAVSCVWKEDVEKALCFNSISDVASLCGKMGFDCVKVVRVEEAKPVLTVM